MKFNDEQIRRQLLAGIAAMPELQQVDVAALSTALTHYLAELNKWNKAYNLTAVREPAEMVTRHILDSLTAGSLLRGTHILDVGTGAGLPGIPLALLFPEKQFSLLDTNGKKTRFVQHAVGALGLRNVQPVQARVENYRPEQLFDTVISRAFASLVDFINGAAQLVAPDGCLLAMKGKLPVDELQALPDNWVVKQTVAVAVPGLEGDRHLLVLERA